MSGSKGAAAWAKHFQGKGEIETSVKKDSQLYKKEGGILKPAGYYIEAGAEILFLNAKEYSQKMPIMLYGENEVYYVTFDNIQKPLSKRVSGIKLKPQDFKTTSQILKAKQLAQNLIDEIDERQDLAPDLKSYLMAITKYWAKIDSTKLSDVTKLNLPENGLNEIKKDYGEMLGAIACCMHKILEPHVKLSPNAKIEFPLRGNEPLVDYYIVDGKKKHSISAKSGTTTNTLKPADIVNLLESKNLYSKYKTKNVGKFTDLINNNTMILFPFMAVNMCAGKKILSDEAIEEAKKFKGTKLDSKDYDIAKFAELIKLIKIPGKDVSPKKEKRPTVGEMFYYTEKYCVDVANSDASYNPTDMFVEATSGSVIYVKFDITKSAKQGVFDIMISDANKQSTQKNIKWRGKNSKLGATDKVGLQP